MFLDKAPVIWVSSSGMPKLSHSRNRRLRKKLAVDEFAEHFIDVRFHLADELTDDQMDALMGLPNVTFWCSTSCELTVSLSTDTNQLDFIAMTEGKFAVEERIRKHAIELANCIGALTGYRYASRIKNIHFGDSVYAEDDYYWGEGKYA